MARPIWEMLQEAKNWADAHEPQDAITWQALFEVHLAWLVNELIKEVCGG